MKFSKVRILPTSGINVLWRKQDQPTYYFAADQGWTLTDSERGVLAEHETRAEVLLVPWAAIASCDVMAESEVWRDNVQASGATIGDAVKRGPGRPPKVA